MGDHASRIVVETPLMDILLAVEPVCVPNVKRRITTQHFFP
jgi:hypothetical protein